jgi:hypothetical protein
MTDVQLPPVPLRTRVAIRLRRPGPWVSLALTMAVVACVACVLIVIEMNAQRCAWREDFTSGTARGIAVAVDEAARPGEGIRGLSDEDREALADRVRDRVLMELPDDNC